MAQQITPTQVASGINQYNGGTIDISVPGTQTITTGFEPRCLEFFTTHTTSTTDAMISMGWWTNGTYHSISAASVGTSTVSNYRNSSTSRCICLDLRDLPILYLRVNSTDSTGFELEATTAHSGIAPYSVYYRAFG